MSTGAPPRLMTAEELLALPEDGIDRELIEGRVREKPMMFHDRWHASVRARLGSLLVGWLDERPAPRGAIVGGAGFRLRRDPDTLVGIDIAYVSAEGLANIPDDFDYFEGPPVLAVEILSVWETHAESVERLRTHLKTGVPLIWQVDPHFQTVLVLRPDAEPELFNINHELSGEPHLPGFRVPVARIFDF